MAALLTNLHLMGSLFAASRVASRAMSSDKMCIRDSLGAERVTVQNLTVVKIDAENNLIAVKGAVPGPRGGVVMLSDSVKKA